MVAELNGGGMPDMVVVIPSENAIALPLNDESGPSSDAAILSVSADDSSTGPLALEVVEINEDELPDILMASANSHEIRVLLRK